MSVYGVLNPRNTVIEFEKTRHTLKFYSSLEATFLHRKIYFSAVLTLIEYTRCIELTAVSSSVP